MLNIGTNFINYDSLFVFSAGIRGNGSLRAFRPFHLSPLLHSLDGVPVVWDKPDFRDLPEAHLLPFQQPVRGYVRKKPHCIPLSGQLLPADQRPWIHRSNDRELPESYFPRPRSHLLSEDPRKNHYFRTQYCRDILQGLPPSRETI